MIETLIDANDSDKALTLIFRFLKEFCTPGKFIPEGYLSTLERDRLSLTLQGKIT